MSPSVSAVVTQGVGNLLEEDDDADARKHALDHA